MKKQYKFKDVFHPQKSKPKKNKKPIRVTELLQCDGSWWSSCDKENGWTEPNTEKYVLLEKDHFDEGGELKTNAPDLILGVTEDLQVLIYAGFWNDGVC